MNICSTADTLLATAFYVFIQILIPFLIYIKF